MNAQAGLRLALLTSLLHPMARRLPAQVVAPQPSDAGVAAQRLLQRLTETESRIAASEREVQTLKLEVQQMRAEILSGSPVAPLQADSKAAVQTANRTGLVGNEDGGAVAVQSQPADQNSVADASSSDQVTTQASQIATLDQSKVETTSKYPLRITGTVLLTSFSNSGRVDQAASPTAALGGPGSTALSMRQTVLGLNADGARVFGGRSRADIRFDFFGDSGVQAYSNATDRLLRLRTAHVAVDWKQTEAFFSLDRPLLSPHQPESLIAVAQPELAWSGNLWSWNPQAGVTQTWGSGTRLRLQAALIDPADPFTTSSDTSPGTISPTLAQRSRRPGFEARIALLGSDEERSSQIGVGGYFSRHASPLNAPQTGTAFDAWAATLDYRFSLGRRLVLSGSVYRGQALGGLGGGGYKDYVYRATAPGLAVRPLDDVGGWVQLHQNVLSRLEWNTGFGIDSAFSREIRSDPTNTPDNLYGGIARNRTIYANVIYGPSAWLLFSVEYRQIYTAPAPGPVWISNSTGAGAAYRF